MYSWALLHFACAWIACTVADTVDPDLPVVINAGLKQAACPADVPALDGCWQHDRNTVPGKGKALRMPLRQVVTDGPAGVVVFDQTRWASGQPRYKTLIGLTRDKARSKPPLSLRCAEISGVLQVQHSSWHAVLPFCSFYSRVWTGQAVSPRAGQVSRGGISLELPHPCSQSIRYGQAASLRQQRRRARGHSP